VLRVKQWKQEDKRHFTYCRPEEEGGGLPEELELELAASWGSGMGMGMELELEREAGERQPI
jgi:hypothetical protein